MFTGPAAPPIGNVQTPNWDWNDRPSDNRGKIIEDGDKVRLMIYDYDVRFSGEKYEFQRFYLLYQY